MGNICCNSPTGAKFGGSFPHSPPSSSSAGRPQCVHTPAAAFRSYRSKKLSHPVAMRATFLSDPSPSLMRPRRRRLRRLCRAQRPSRSPPPPGSIRPPSGATPDLPATTHSDTRRNKPHDPNEREACTVRERRQGREVRRGKSKRVRTGGGRVWILGGARGVLSQSCTGDGTASTRRGYTREPVAPGPQLRRISIITRR